MTFKINRPKKEKSEVIGQEQITPSGQPIISTSNEPITINRPKNIKPLEELTVPQQAFLQRKSQWGTVSPAETFQHPENLKDFDRWLKDTEDIRDISTKFGGLSFAAAENQSNWQRLGYALTQTIVGHAIGGTLTGIGVLLDPIGNIRKLAGHHDGEWGTENVLTTFGNWLQEETMHNWTPIHQTQKASEGWAPGDASWWFSHAPSIASSLGMIAATFTGAGAIGLAGRAMGIAGRMSKGTKMATNVLGRSVMSRTIYSHLEAKDTYDQAFEDAMGRGLSNHEATKYASDAAAFKFRIGYANIWQDAIQWTMIIKGPGFARRGMAKHLDDIAHGSPQARALLGQAAPGKMTKAGRFVGEWVGQSPKQLLSHGLLQGFEEYNIQWQKKEGKRYADRMIGDEEGRQWEGFTDRLHEHTLDRHTWDSTFWGFAGGLVFGGASSTLQKATTRRSRADEKKELQRLVQKANDVAGDIKAMTIAVNKGDHYQVRKIQEDMVAKAGLESARNGTLEIEMSFLEGLANQTEAQLAESGYTKEDQVTAKQTLEKLQRFEKIYDRNINKSNGSVESTLLAEKKTVNEYKLQEAKQELNEIARELADITEEGALNIPENTSAEAVNIARLERRQAAITRYIDDLTQTKSSAAQEYLQEGGQKVLENAADQLQTMYDAVDKELKAAQENYDEVKTTFSKEIKETDGSFLKRTRNEQATKEYSNWTDVDKLEHAYVRALISRDSWQKEFDRFSDKKIQDEFVQHIKEKQKLVAESLNNEEIDIQAIVEEAEVTETFTTKDGELIEGEKKDKKDLAIFTLQEDGGVQAHRVKFERTTNDGEGIVVRLYNDEGVSTNNVVTLKKDGTVVGKDLGVVSRWGLEKVLPSESERRNNPRIEKFNTAYAELTDRIQSREVATRQQLTSIDNVQKQVVQGIESLQKANLDSTKQQAELKPTPENREILDKLGIQQVENDAKILLNLNELENLNEDLNILKAEVQNELDYLQELVTNLPEDLKYFYPGVKFERFLNTLGERQEALQNSISTIDDTSNKLSQYIQNVKTQLEKHRAELSKLEQALQKYGITNPNDVGNLPRNIKVGLSRRRATIQKKEQDLLTREREQEDLIHQRNELNEALEALKTDLGLSLQLAILWNSLYGDYIAKEHRTPSKKVKPKSDVKEENLEKEGEVLPPPMKPYQNTMAAFNYTTINETEAINSLEENNSTEPQLLFQRFLDDYTFPSKKSKGYTELQLYNRKQLLDNLKDKFSQEQIDYIGKDFMKNGVFVVPVQKIKGKWTPVEVDSILRENTKTPIFSVLNEVFGEQGIEFEVNDQNQLFVIRPTTGYRFIDATKEVRKLEEQGVDVAEAIEKVKANLKKHAEEYRKEIRQPALDGKGKRHTIAAISPGDLQMDKDESNSLPSIIGKQAKEIQLVIADSNETTYRGHSFATHPGFVYLQYKGRLVPVKRNFLDTQDRNRVTNLVEFIMQSKDAVAITEAMDGINSTTFLTYHSKEIRKKQEARKTQTQYEPSDYTFYIAEDKKGNILGVQMGDRYISKRDFLGNIEESKSAVNTFLANKYYQVDSRQLENKNNSITLLDVKEGQLDDSNTINYKEWLLNQPKEGEAKITGKFPKAEQTDKNTEGLVNPILIHRGALLGNKEGEVSKKVEEESNKKEQKEVKKNLEKEKEEKGVKEKIEKGLEGDDFITETPVEAKPEESSLPDYTDEQVRTDERKQQEARKKKDAEVPPAAKRDVPKGQEPKRDVSDDIFTDLESESLFTPTERINLQQELKEYYKMFPDANVIPIKNRLIDGQFGGRFVSEADGGAFTLVSNLAVKGTLYHEGFHNYMQRFITSEERTRIINEALELGGEREFYLKVGEENKWVSLNELKNQLAPEQFNKKVEEVIAEEFRNYMLTRNKEKYRFGQAHRKKNLFLKMWDTIVKWLEKVTGKTLTTSDAIERVFNEVASNQWTEDKVVNRPNTVLNKIEGYSVEDSSILVRGLNKYFFDYLFHNEVLDDVNLTNLGESINEIYEDIYLNLQKHTNEAYKQGIVKPIHNIILENWDNLVKEHTKYLRQHRIQLEVTELDVLPEDKQTRDNKEFVQTNTIDVKSLVSSDVKLLVAGLPGTPKHIKGYESHPVSNTVDYGKAFGLLHKRLANKTVADMQTELANMAERHGFVKVLLSRLGLNESGEVKQDATKKQKDILAKFLTHMNKADNDYIIGIVSEGMYTVSQETSTRRNRMLDSWKNNSKTKIKNKVFSLSRGEYLLDRKAKINLDGKEYTLDTILKKENPLKGILQENTTDFTKDYLDLFGITIPEYYLNQDLMGKTMKYLHSELRQKIKEGEAIKIDEIFDRNVFAIRKELNQLADELSKLDDSFVDNQILTSKGHEYAISLKTKLHRTLENLQQVKLDAAYEKFNPETGQGNIALYSSVLYTQIREGKIKPEIKILRNVGQEVGDKNDIKNLTPTDLSAFMITNILEGKISFSRSEGRAIEYAFDFGKDYIVPLSRTQQLNRYKNYLKGEIISALAFKNSPDFSRFVSKEGSDNLVFFREITEEITEILENDSLSELFEPTLWIAKANTIISNNERKINDALNKYIEETTTDLVNSLLNNDLFIKVGDNKYESIGFSNQLIRLKKNRRDTIRPDADGNITIEQLRKFAETVNFYYLTTGIEANKLITGDLNIYGMKYHKRTNTYTSTVTPAINEGWYLSHLNEYYQRFDGNQNVGIRKELVMADMNVQADHYTIIEHYLKEQAKPYKDGINEADGVGLATLDGYRSLALRTNVWNDNYEKTWQYEAQYAFKLLRAWEIENNVPAKQRKYTEQRFSELFGEHIPENASMYKQYHQGEEISIEHISRNALPVLKPQGTGLILNQGMVQANRMDITKTSIAPMLPTNLEGTTMFDLFRESTDQGLDFIFFESAKKGETVGNTDGLLPSLYTTDAEGNTIVNSINNLINKEKFIPTEISWADIGNQLDIDPSGKHKVTASTQERRQLFADLFEQGELVKGMERFRNTFTEFNSLNSHLVGRHMNRFIEEYGLKHDDEGISLAEAETLLNKINEELNSRLIPDNVAEGVDIVLNSSRKLFDTLPNKRQLMNLLQGRFRNQVINYKMRGDMMVQTPSTGFETQVRPTVKSSNHLKFYRLLDKNGKEVTDIKNIKDVVSVAPAQGHITLPPNLISFVKKNYKGANFEAKLRQFNEDLVNPNWKYYELFKKIRTYIGNRIPLEHINAMEVLEITKFLSPSSGSTVVLPTEMVTKTGSDYDIDKLTTYFNNIKINKKGLPIYNEYLTEENSTLTERAKAIYNSGDDLVRLMNPNIHISYAKDVQSVKKAIFEYIQLKEAAKDLDPVIRELNAKEEFLDDKIQELFQAKKGKQAAALVEERASIILAQRTRLNLIYEGLEDQYKVTKETIIEIEDVLQGLPIEEQNTTGAVENRINALKQEVLLAPENFATLIRPNNSEVINKHADAITGKPQNVPLHKLLDLGYNIEVGLKQWANTDLIGILAVNNTSHSTFQQNMTRFDAKVYHNLFEDFKEPAEGEYNISYVTDSENNKISNNIQAMLTGALDAGGELDPATGRINLTRATVGPYMLLNRTGKGGQKPLGLSTLTRFFTSPIIQEYERLSRINESEVTKERKYSVNKRDIAYKTLVKLAEQQGEKVKIDSKEHVFLFEHVDNLMKAKPGEINQYKDDLNKALEHFKLHEGLLSVREFKANPLKTLETYLYYLEMAKSLKGLQTVLRYDASLPKDRLFTRINQIQETRLRDLALFNNEDIDGILSNTFLGAFKQAHDTSFEAFSEFELSDVSVALQTLFFDEGGLVDIYTNPMLAIPNERIHRAVQKLQNAFVTAILHTTPRNEKAFNSRYQELFTGKNSLAKRIQKISQKEEFKDNAFIVELVPIIDEYINKRQRTTDIDYLKTLGDKKAVEAQNAVTEGFRELIHSNDSEVATFAKDLVKGSILQSGVQLSPASFFESIPAEIYQPILDQVFDKYLKLEKDKPLLQNFDEQFVDNVFSNLRFDRDVVPRHAPFKKGQKPTLAKDYNSMDVYTNNPNSQYPYLSVELSNLPREQQLKLKKEGKEIPKEVYIYKDTKRIKNKGKPYQAKIYERIPNRGDAYRLFEMPEPGKGSIIEKNNVGHYVTKDENVDISKQVQGQQLERADTTQLPQDINSREYNQKIADLNKGKKIRIKYDKYKTSFEATFTGQVEKVVSPTEVRYDDGRVEYKSDGIYRLQFKTNTGKIVTADTSEIQGDYTEPIISSRIDSTQLVEFKPNNELLYKYDTLLKELGINKQSVNTIFNEGSEVNAMSKVRALQEIQAFRNNRVEFDKLSQDTISFVLHSMPDTHVLKKKLMNQVKQSEVYKEAYSEYSDVYEGNEYRIQYEALSSILSYNITAEAAPINTQNAARGVQKYMNEAFTLATPVQQAAYRLMSETYTQLQKKQSEQIEASERYEDTDITNRDTEVAKWNQQIQAERQRIIEENNRVLQEYGDDVSPTENQNELNKVGTQADIQFREALLKHVPMLRDFASYEVGEIVKMINNGEFKIIC